MAIVFQNTNTKISFDEQLYNSPCMITVSGTTKKYTRTISTTNTVSPRLCTPYATLACSAINALPREDYIKALYHFETSGTTGIDICDGTYNWSEGGGAGYSSTQKKFGDYSGRGNAFVIPAYAKISSGVTIKFWYYATNAQDDGPFVLYFNDDIHLVISPYRSSEGSGKAKIFYDCEKDGLERYSPDSGVLEVTTNEWHHWFVCIYKTKTYIFVDGKKQLEIGVRSGATTLCALYCANNKGYVDELEIRNGSQYTSSTKFTLPTNETTVNSAHIALNHFNDNEENGYPNINMRYVNGTASVTTNYRRFGKSSLSGSLMSILKEPCSTNACTIEFWGYNQTATNGGILTVMCNMPNVWMQCCPRHAERGGSKGGGYWYTNNNDADPSYSPADLEVEASLSLSWNHFAYTFSNSGVTYWINGVKKTTYGYPSGVNMITGFRIYNASASSYIDELRISNKVLYTKDFTPPTKAFD